MSSPKSASSAAGPERSTVASRRVSGRKTSLMVRRFSLIGRNEDERL